MYASEERNQVTPYAFGNELEWLRSAAKNFKRAVMIGAGPGIMGIALMEGNHDLILTILDIDTCYYARKHLDSAGFPVVGYVVADSSAYDYVGLPLDFLLVDGDHTKEGVIRDVENWYRYVRPGGLIFFHDYVNVNEDTTNGVAEALTELTKRDIINIEDIDTPGISIVYRKL